MDNREYSDRGFGQPGNAAGAGRKMQRAFAADGGLAFADISTASIRHVMKSSLILLVMLCACPSFAGVYKWTDPQGHIHYGDAPPPDAKTASLKLQTYAGPVQVSRINRTDSGVTLYTTDWCGVCKRAKAFLKQNGVPFHEWDVEKTDYGETKFRQLGGGGVPLITLGSERMLGFDEERFMELWKNYQNRQ